MHRANRAASLVGGLLLSAASTTPWAQHFELFSTSDRPFSQQAKVQAEGIVVTEYNLQTASAVLEQTLSEGLSNNPEQAIQQVKALLQQLPPGQFEHAVKQAFAAQQYALNQGITHVPAVLINGEAMVYGVTDLTQVLQHYRLWQMDQPHD